MFWDICSEYPILVQAYIDEARVMITEKDGVRCTVGPKHSTNWEGKTRHTTLVPRRPSSASSDAELESGTDTTSSCNNPENGSGPHYGSDDAVQKYFDTIETLPTLVCKACAQGKVYQPTDYELEVARRVKNLTGETAEMFRAWLDEHDNSQRRTDEEVGMKL